MAIHGAHAGKVASIDLASREGPILALRGVDPSLHERWEKEHAADDTWAVAAVERLRTTSARTATGSELVPPGELRGTLLFHEILRHCEIDDTVGTVLHLTSSSVGFLSVYRGLSREPFTEADRDLHDWIGRHARRAFGLGALLARERSQSHAFLERLPCAAFVCEADGRIVLRNERGEALLRRGEGLRARRDKLCTERPADRSALEHALASATRSAAGESLDGGTSLPVRREPGRAPLGVFVDPLPRGGPGAEAFGEAFLRPVALVLASDPEARTMLPEAALAATFGLTPVESRMLAALAAGETPYEYAERTGVSRETARFHVKRLLAKTGARRQADLVRLALESVARIARPAPGAE